MNKKILFVLLIAVQFSVAFAQDNALTARSEYYAAEEAYGNGDFEGCLEYLQKAKSLNGNNRAIQYLKVKALYGFEKYEETEEALNLFFEMTDKSMENTPQYQEMVKIITVLNLRAGERRKVEQKDWSLAINSNNPEEIYAFFEKYPTSKFLNSKDSLLAAIETKYYNDLLATGDKSSIEKYLDYYPKGKYSATISTELNDIRMAEQAQELAEKKDLLERAKTTLNGYKRRQIFNTTFFCLGVGLLTTGILKITEDEASDKVIVMGAAFTLVGLILAAAEFSALKDYGGYIKGQKRRVKQLENELSINPVYFKKNKAIGLSLTYNF